MFRCEDYPCCGHEQGECVDPDREDKDTHLPLPCVECGGRIKYGEELPNIPSLHQKCASMLFNDEDRYYD